MKPRGLVKMSASWWAEVTWSVFKRLAWILSQIKWQSTSICLVRSWNTGFAAIWRATWLPQKRAAAMGWAIWKSWSNERSQVISQVVIAMALYSASPEDLETIDCFLECQEMRESPRKTQNPVTDLRVSEQPAQLESQKALSCNGLVEGKNNPCLGVPLRYCNTRCATCR